MKDQLDEHTSLVTNRLRDLDLDENTVGFCYEADRHLFVNAALDHGPMLIGLDTNVLIDLAEHGAALFEDEDLPATVVEPQLGFLRDLAWLIELWLVRDIRFVPLHRSLSDFGPGTTDVRVALRTATVRDLEESLSHQTSEWSTVDRRPLDEAHVQLSKTLPPDVVRGQADRELLQESCRLGLDVFLTQDRPVLRARGVLARGWPNIESPTSLRERFLRLRVGGFSGGLVGHLDCPYSEIQLFPSMDKWNGLLSVLG